MVNKDYQNVFSTLGRGGARAPSAPPGYAYAVALGLGVSVRVGG